MADSVSFGSSESVPDLSGYKLCGFCRMRLPAGAQNGDYCSSWCDEQDNEWWRQIHDEVPRKDPLEGRQWLSLGGDGI